MLPLRLRRLLDEERALALVLALGVMTALAATTASVIAYTSSNSRASTLSLADQQALALAEAAHNNARATLFAAPDPRDPAAVPETDVEYTTGTATHAGSLASSVWTLTGTGTARNPTGGEPVVRQVTGRVRISTGQRSSANNAIWNYLYADSLSSCTTLSNNVVIDIPLYVRGDLCMNNTARVSGDYIQVGGTVTLNNTATIGTSDEPLVAARIGGGCRLGGGAFSSPCSAAQRVYADEVTAAPDGLVKPPVDLQSWYENAQPGPRHGCTEGSFPGGFDNDATMNRSRGTVDLMPTSAYDCRVLDGGGNVIGQLTWTPGQGETPGTLVIAGTIFFDGDIELAGNDYGVYQGKATIYSSGSITFSNNAKLCGVAACDGGWDANENLLAFVAGDDFRMSNDSKFQGAVYAVDDFSESNNATVWGPIIADELFISNSGINHYVPLGTLLPGMPSTYEEVTVLEDVESGFGD
jgi:Tfp pilus assembly protein PilX